MYAKISRRQVAWVLLASLTLIILCVSGLWIYIISADAETGVQETTVKTLLEEDNINITWEKYDNYPAIGKEEDLEQRFIGTGLTREEKARLPALLQAYADGKRPLFPAQPLTDADNISIVPLDPAEYAGLTEYYLLPGKALTEQKLLQLIDYSAKRGEAFSADMLTSKNCNRGGYSSSNRYLSTGELGRWKILSRRAQMEGASRFSPELSPKMLPVKGVGSMARDYEKFNNYGSFHFYPIREMTDEELLQAICFENYQGYTNLKPENDERLDPVGDAARIRALLEEYMGMPIAAENYMLRYRRKNDDG